MKQTAVEWLATYLKEITSLNCDEVIEHAKSMEREQIVKAYTDTLPFTPENIAKGEHYYNVNFKPLEKSKRG